MNIKRMRRESKRGNRDKYKDEKEGKRLNNESD